MAQQERPGDPVIPTARPASAQASERTSTHRIAWTLISTCIRAPATFPTNCTRDVLVGTVLLKVYAKCLDEQDAIAKRRIEGAFTPLQIWALSGVTTREQELRREKTGWPA